MRRLVFLLVLALASAAQAAVETTTVQGKVVLPNGGSATGGAITATLSQSGTTPDTTSGANQRVGGRAAGTIGAGGDVTLVLVPNDAISPSGTYYEVRISTTGPVRASWVELWSVTTSPDPVDIGAITRLQVASGITVGNYIVYVDTEPSGTCTLNDTPRYATDTDKHCECVSAIWTCTSAGGGSSGFADITSGTNTTAAMVLGTGASLATSGSGVNTANALATGDYGDWTVSTGVATIDTDAVALGTDTTGGYAASVSEGGPATTATALAANGANCSAGNYPLGVDASGAVEGCTADDDVPEAGDFGAATDLDANGAVLSGGVGASELGDDIPCTGGQAIRRNGGDSAWECFTPGAASGDIEAVGDCATGACFDGTAGTTLTFNNVGGDATLDYDGTDFSFSKPITIAQDTSPGYVDLMEGSAGGTDALRLQAPTTVTASGYTCTFLDAQDMVPDTCIGGVLADELIDLSSEVTGSAADANVDNAITIDHSSSGTLDLDQTTAPTAEGRIAWDATNDEIEIGDGTGTQVFVPTGTLTDAQYCTYDSAANEIDCNTTPGGSGDVTDVGDCATGACFDGTAGTVLTFDNVGGDGTISYDGTEFDVSHPINVAQQTTAGFYRFYEASANGTNYIDITGASAVGTNRSCTLEDDASPFGDTCVQNDITIDHTSAGSLRIENGTAPTLANAGEIALDTDVLSGSTGQGLMILHDGTTNPTYVVATTDTPADNEIPKFDSTTGTITWEADGGGGGGTTGMRRSLLNFATVPDTSGKVYSEPLTVHGSNDRWRQLVWTFTQGSSTQNCLYGSFSLSADYSSSPSVVVVWTSAATSGDVEWDFEYRPISGTENLDQASSGESNLGNDDNSTAPSSAFGRVEYDMGALSGLADNDTIQFRFCRDEVDAGDTMADEALLVDLLLEYDQ